MTTLLLSLCLAAGPQPVLPPPIPAPVAPVRHPTLKEFAVTFVPQPGVYEVMIEHPGTCQPVCVVFKLPEGCPKVRVHRRSIEFDYGRCEVEITFRTRGRVEVEYN